MDLNRKNTIVLTSLKILNLWNNNPDLTFAQLLLKITKATRLNQLKNMRDDKFLKLVEEFEQTLGVEGK